MIELPSGSVPLDFAYRIHTEVGNQTIGAKVNGRIVPLDHQLKTGDIVEILTSETFVRSEPGLVEDCPILHARSKVKQWFKREAGENVEKGRDMLEREIKRASVLRCRMDDR